ncbi:hypothetical protein SBOR_7955 [Sclerotinia borealis F-4128]|uniref:F-box domain-containing protein n=1 Tax=Sclerotinia borealis (strain F-4128) TaxID=1432307 RepID=W9C4G8_SCLBF|nr:hypothetical protein SBOR_7955 [Sclerotinia borealis F-4128]
MATSTPYTGKSITDTLATELLGMICGYLPREDLLSFRLTSKTCAEVASKDLVQDLNVMFTEKSFENLLNISKQPSLSKHVRSLYYEPRTLRPVSRVALETAMQMDWYADNGPTPYPISREPIEYWESYSDISNRESHIMVSYYDISVLAQALPNFKNLKKIRVDSDGLPSPQASSAHIPTGNECKWLLHHDPTDQNCTRFRALLSILTAVSLPGTELTSFTATVIPDRFFRIFNGNRNLMLPIAPYLKRIDISLAPIDWLKTSREVDLGIHKFLRPAANLEDLRIAIDRKYLNDGWDHNTPIPWNSVVGSWKIPKLRNLILCNASGTQECFSKFLEDHTETLDYVCMENMWLEGDISGWGSVFTTLQSLALSTCQLEGTWAGRWDAKTNEPLSVSMDLRYYQIHSERYPGLSVLLKRLEDDESLVPNLKRLLQLFIVDGPLPAGDLKFTASKAWEIAVRQAKFPRGDIDGA